MSESNGPQVPGQEPQVPAEPDIPLEDTVQQYTLAQVSEQVEVTAAEPVPAQPQYTPQPQAPQPQGQYAPQPQVPGQPYTPASQAPQPQAPGPQYMPQGQYAPQPQGQYAPQPQVPPQQQYAPQPGQMPGQQQYAPQGQMPGQQYVPGQAQYAPGQYTPQSQGPGPAKSPKRMKGWVLGLIIGGGVLLLAGIVVLVLFLMGVGPFSKDAGTDSAIQAELEANPELTTLYEGCAAGDMLACDNLFMQSPIDSALEAFADDCGGHAKVGMWCDPSFTIFEEEEFTEDESEDQGLDWGDEDDSGDVGEPSDSGDFDQAKIASELAENPELKPLYEACAAGDMEACDDLFFETPYDSELERFADTCGGTDSSGGWCNPF